MGDVVAFQLREKPSRRNSEPPAGGAQILFFLGVRYLRIEEPQEEARAPDRGRRPKGGKKRKTRAG